MLCTVNYHQDDWVELLPLAEFTYYNTIYPPTKYTPFFANYGPYPKFDTSHTQNSTSNPATKDFATRLFEIHQEIKLHLHEAQQIYKTNVDEERKEPPLLKLETKYGSFDATFNLNDFQIN